MHVVVSYFILFLFDCNFCEYILFYEYILNTHSFIKVLKSFMCYIVFILLIYFHSYSLESNTQHVTRVLCLGVECSLCTVIFLPMQVIYLLC